MCHANCNQGRCRAQSAGELLTAGFRRMAVVSHCCWQKISARHQGEKQELIWSGLLRLKEACWQPWCRKKITIHGARGIFFSSTVFFCNQVLWWLVVTSTSQQERIAVLIFAGPIFARVSACIFVLCPPPVSQAAPRLSVISYLTSDTLFLHSCLPLTNLPSITDISQSHRSGKWDFWLAFCMHTLLLSRHQYSKTGLDTACVRTLFVRSDFR